MPIVNTSYETLGTLSGVKVSFHSDYEKSWRSNDFVFTEEKILGRTSSMLNSVVLYQVDRALR